MVPTTDQIARILLDGQRLLLLVPRKHPLFVLSVTGNFFLDWIQTVARVYNQSDCWICSELPLSAASGLPWKLHAGNWSDWSAFRDWASKHNYTVSWDRIPMVPSNSFASQNETRFHSYSLIKEQVSKTRPVLGYSIHDGRGWLSAIQVEYTDLASVCIERNGDPFRVMGWTPKRLCNLTLNITSDSWVGWQDTVKKVRAYISPAGGLWTCGNHGWPYLPFNWTGRCTWGRPYLPVTITKTLSNKPHNLGAMKARHRVARTLLPTLGPIYPMSLYIAGKQSTLTLEVQMSTFLNYTLNKSKQSIALLKKETTRIRQVILQNRIALDMLTAAQGGTCALVGIECCVYVPDLHANASHTLNKMQKHIKAIEAIGQDPLSRWLASLPSHWRLLMMGILSFLLGLSLVFLCLCFFCSVWIPCTSGTYEVPQLRSKK